MGNTRCTVKRNNRIPSYNLGGTCMFRFFKNVSKEMKKVSWPTGKELRGYTVTVVGTVAFVAVFFAVIDALISFLLNLL